MLKLHFIRTMLDILDFTIVFQGKKDENLYTKEFIKKETCHVFHATLSYTPDCCLKYGMENNQCVSKGNPPYLTTFLLKWPCRGDKQPY